MKPVKYCKVAATIFALIAIGHAYRLVDPFSIQIGSHSVSEAASWVVLVLAAAFSALGFRAKG